MKSSMKSNILLVDDEVQSLHIMELILTLQGCQVSKFTDAQSALQELITSQLSDNPFDLLITDIEMPKMRGDELIDELRSFGITIPTIVMSGYGDKELVIELLRKGCIDYIDKPITPQDLIKRVSLVLDQAEKQRHKQDQSEKLAELGIFVNELIHDINNMLCTSSGFADLVQCQFSSNKKLNNYLSKISTSTTYASKLTKQLLAISQNKKINLGILNLGIEIEQWLDMLKIVAGKKIQVKINTPSYIPDIIADQISIQRLLMNLVINSRNIMPKGGGITISVKEVEIDTKNSNKEHHTNAETYVCLSLTYTCSEIDVETLPLISQPYKTLLSKNDRTSRSLSTIKKIIHDHKGKMDILYEHNRSYILKIIFPTA